MNPFAAVEPIGAARGPLATMQALADALAGPAPQPVMDAAGGAMHGPDANPVIDLRDGLQSGLQSGLNHGPADAMKSAASNALMNPSAPAQLPLSATIPAAVTTAQAMQGRFTLGQLAAEPTALRLATEMPLGATAAEAARGAPINPLAAEAGSAPRAAFTLAVPVLLTPTFTTAGQAARSHEAPDSPQARHHDADPQQRPHDSKSDDTDGALEDATTAPDGANDNTAAGLDSDADSDADSSASSEPEALALQALLRRAEQLEALRELALGRRVLLVLPQAGGGHGAAPAAAALLTSEKVQRFGARWWPGTANAVRPGWLRWRVFRSGDPQLDSGLRSRSASTACHLRLGPHAPHLTDAGTAQVELAERIRFTQALGAQWSLLVVAAPPGAFT